MDMLKSLNFKKKMVINKQIDFLRSSDCFEGDWYLSRYEDLDKEKVDPARHYVLHGAAEGRNPSPEFDTQRYMELYPDVVQSGMNPFYHYLMFGKDEGRLTDAFPVVNSKPEELQSDPPMEPLPVNASAGSKVEPGGRRHEKEIERSRELVQENELLLLQLHQVQEELEQYLVKSQETAVLQVLVERLTEEKAVDAQVVNELKVQMEQLTKERDAQSRLSAERLSRIEELSGQVDHLRRELEEKENTLKQTEDQSAEISQRQVMLDEELIKAEAQLELIKDIILREKAF